MNEPVSLVLSLLDLFGIAVFAVSGALAAGRKRMDMFGVVIVAVVTSIGGGTIRDLVLGIRPVFWVGQPAVVVTAVIAALVMFVGVRFVRFPLKLLLLFDAVGLAFVTVVGCRRAADLGTDDVITVMMGMLTGTAGGMVRDILCGEIPLILRREIYATASLLGGVVFVMLDHTGMERGLSAPLAAAVVLAVRLAALRWELSLPVFPTHEESA